MPESDQVMSALKRRPPRLIDVAAAAGVDTSTASRALTGAQDRPVSSATRERVRRAADELGYTANAFARALRTDSAGAIGVLVPSLRNTAWGLMLRGVVAEATRLGLSVLLAEDDGVPEGESAYERLLAEARIDGLIVVSARPGSAFPGRLIASGAACVFAGRSSSGSGRNVTLREEDVSIQAVEHLAALGHRQIAHVTGPARSSTITDRRVDALIAACRERGLPEPVILRGSFDEAGGAAATTAILDHPSRPTAILVTNFNQVFGALAAIRLRGLRVPQDISVLGADDDPVLGYLDPPFTAFARPNEELGATAVKALVEQMQGRGTADIEVSSPVELVIRGSTGRVPADREPAPPIDALPGRRRTE